MTVTRARPNRTTSRRLTRGPHSISLSAGVSGARPRLSSLSAEPYSARKFLPSTAERSKLTSPNVGSCSSTGRAADCQAVGKAATPPKSPTNSRDFIATGPSMSTNLRSPAGGTSPSPKKRRKLSLFANVRLLEGCRAGRAALRIGSVRTEVISFCFDAFFDANRCPLRQKTLW
jgi:hypothetical protein